MIHEKFAAAQEIAPTASVRDMLRDIAAGLDARFVQVGTVLARAIETIDRIVHGLDAVGNAFSAGESQAAVERLTGVAHNLSTVPVQQAERRAEITAIRGSSSLLWKDIEEVREALRVLQIYSLNVKIAASGADAFIEFADRMRDQLIAGDENIKGFDVRLVDLERSLAGMSRSDELLAIECAKVVPEVPERLIKDASELSAHQMKLTRIATEVGEIARTIQGNVAAVLGALQIGDITRQRLEHVVAGCLAADAGTGTGTGAGEDSLDQEAAAAVQAHMFRLFAAQLLDTASDFSRETAVIIQSLRQIAPQASRLLAFRSNENSADNGHMFLRRLETGIVQADAMTVQLRNADRQANEIVRIIVDTVDDLTVRANIVRNLRIDVQHMAINIGLRCRKMEAIGKPVTVIANEIRTYSAKLDEATSGITDAARELGVISLAMRKRGEKGEGDSEHALGDSLDTIRESARRTEVAMAIAGDDAGAIADILRDTIDQLEDAMAVGITIESLAAALTALMDGSGCHDAPDSAEQMLSTLMQQLARSYTMASERAIHDQFLRPGMAPVSSAAPAPGFSDDDDDDDGLF